MEDIMTWDLIVIILCGVNILFAISRHNWIALLGWVVGGLGFLKCLLLS